MWRLQEILSRSRAHACSLQPAAGSQGELTGLMLMRAYFADRGEASARHDRHRRHRARHESRERHDGGLPAGEGADGRSAATSTSRTCGARRRAHSRPDAHEPVDARPLRRAHRRRSRRSSTTSVASSTTTGRNLNAVCGISRPGRHGLRHRPHQPAQDRSRQPHGRWRPGGGPIVVPRQARSRSCRSRRWCKDGDSFRLDFDRPKSIGKVRGLHRAVRRLRPLRTRTSDRTGRGCGRCPRSPCSMRTTCLPSSRTPTTCRSTGFACTSSFSARGRSSASMGSRRPTLRSG
jgi:glycine dehydrogenase subunit 2